MQEYDGSYVDYNYALLQMKIEQQELAAADMEEIERNRKIVDRLEMVPLLWTVLQGEEVFMLGFLFWSVWKQKTKSPFVDIRQPEIMLYAENNSVENPEKVSEGEKNPKMENIGAEAAAVETVLKVEDYNVTFDREIMEHVPLPSEW